MHHRTTHGQHCQCHSCGTTALVVKHDRYQREWQRTSKGWRSFNPSTGRAIAIDR